MDDIKNPISNYPLCWPDGWKRTTINNRRPGYFNKQSREYQPSTVPGVRGYDRVTRRDVTVSDGLGRILESLTKMGVERQDVIISSNVPTRLDGLPRSGAAEPSDPGVAVYWKRIGEKRTSCMAVDRYDRVADNMAALAATLEALRAIERHGGAQILDRAFRGFAALPEHATHPWRNVLGFAVNVPVSLGDVQSKFRELTKQHHPDVGGDRDKFEELVRARDTALQEITC